VPRFLAATASAANASGAARQLSSPPGLHAGLRDRPLSLAADPLRLQAGGAEPYVATSDVPCRTVAACAWAPSLAFAASPPVFRQATRHWPRHQDLNDATRLKETPSRAQDAFRRLRSRSRDRAKHLRDPCYVRAGRLAPVRPEPPSLPSSRGSGHFVTSPRRLGSPRGSPRHHGHGASHRPLQPTFDTSTRGPLDFRARGLRRTDRRVLHRPKPVSPERRQTALRQSDPG
jgi:hypothetical protein